MRLGPFARLDECNRPPEDAEAKDAEEADEVERELEKAKSALVDQQELLAWAEQQKDLTAPDAWEALDEAWDKVLREQGLPDTEYLDTERELQEFLERVGLTGDRLRRHLLETQRGFIDDARELVERLEARLSVARR